MFRAAAVLVLTTVALAQTDYRARLTALLPASGQAARVMEWRTTAAGVALIQDRLATTAPNLLDNFAASVRVGKVPPYDPRYGVTPEEYARLVVFRNTLATTGRSVKLNVTRTDRKLTFGQAAGAEALRGISLDLVSGEMRLPEGYVARPHAVQVSADVDGTGLGARSGWGWKFQGSDPKTFNAIDASVSLMRLSSGSVVLTYNRISIVKGRLQPEVQLYLTYPHP
ncbi:hypothetical protein [Deinococcus maricopensis]|uniref:hypothetical protein n=1 Tax=Deinococcus maricopensis TaxID=309887 RepID=UPI0011D1ECC7|nr:hypothetical protein [Deinococcus maricopensis]